LGCLYYQLGKDALAIRYLLKATEMDASYGEAWQLLGLAYQRSENLESARSAFQKAEAKGLSPEQHRGRGRKPPALLSTGTSKRKGLLTGGDTRLARALREDALRAFAQAKDG
jgi:tetratricopeptide (TPR) repeat protein